MLADLFFPENQLTINREIAKKLGLLPAVYVSSLFALCDKGSMEMSLDRKKIQEYTTLSTSNQKAAEKVLINLGVIKITGDEGSQVISFDYMLLLSLFQQENEKFTQELQVAAKVGKAVNKAEKDEFIKQALKNKIQASNPELHRSYEDWIDTMYDRFHFLNAKGLREAESIVDQAATLSDGRRSLDAALGILDIAIARGWRNISLAAKTYKETVMQTEVHSNSGEVEYHPAEEVF